MRIAIEFNSGTTAFADDRAEANKTIARFAEYGWTVVRTYEYDDSDPCDFAVIYKDEKGVRRRDVSTFTRHGAQQKARQIRAIKGFSDVKVVAQARAAGLPSLTGA